jgi:2-polyprenyl-3-methyl-5-hydroxy-6-metoxy-1,4-benzoquinol methylase
MKQGELNRDLYQKRFEEMDVFRVKFYQTFYEAFLCKYIPSHSRVLEIGAGHCELINAIQAEYKVALDINPDVCRYAADDVNAICGTIECFPSIEGQFGVIIANNVLEHLTHAHIVDTLLAAKELLGHDGILILIQPNIRYCYRDFWMFFDHITPLDDRAVVELLKSLEYEIVEAKPKFLPYTTKSRIPRSMSFVKMYLHIPLLWNLFGKQMLIVASKKD